MLTICNNKDKKDASYIIMLQRTITKKDKSNFNDKTNIINTKMKNGKLRRMLIRKEKLNYC